MKKDKLPQLTSSRSFYLKPVEIPMNNRQGDKSEMVEVKEEALNKCCMRECVRRSKPFCSSEIENRDIHMPNATPFRKRHESVRVGVNTTGA